MLFLGDFNDNRNHREGGVARTCENRQNIGDDRGQVVDVLRIRAKDAFGDLNEVVKTTSELHGGNGRDHRGDDQDNVPGNVTRLHAEEQTEDEHAGTARIADADAANADTEKDRAQKDDDLKNEH